MGVLDRRHPIDPVDTVIGIWLAWNLGTGAYVYGHLIYWTVFAIVSIPCIRYFIHSNMLTLAETLTPRIMMCHFGLSKTQL